MWVTSSRPDVLRLRASGVHTLPAWQVTQPGSVEPPGRIGVSRYFCFSQPCFSSHSACCSALAGLWPARENSVARSRPPWQTVQPNWV